MAGTANDLLRVARGEIGVREAGGGTRGNRQKYSAQLGLPVTEWCAIYVSWCLRKARVPRAYVSTRVTLFARHYAGSGRFVRRPRPGDIVCFDWGMNGRFDHTGFVEKVLSRNRIQTIEGNTNPGNGRDGVYRMVRSTRHVRGYCRPHFRPVVRPPGNGTGPRPARYVVRSGDTLSLIGRRLNLDWRRLAAVNGLRSPYLIRPGQVLKLGGPVRRPVPRRRYHRVVRGNTLGGIAAKYRTTVARLTRLNRQIRNPNLIRPGDRIRVR
jgi:LysM repeat protein